MDYRILGPLEVDDDEGRSVDLRRRQPTRVLVQLLLAANRVVSADILCEVLWGYQLPARALPTLQVNVSRLRTALGRPDLIVTKPPGYLLRVGPDELDAEIAERLIREGLRAAEEDNPSLASDRLTTALAMWRGEALADFAYEDFVRVDAERLGELRLIALEARIEADLKLERHAMVVAELEALVATYPLRERLWSLLMTALYRSGRQADALRAFARAATTLRSELGVEPSQELRDLEERILQQDAGLTPTTEVHPVGRHLPSGRVTFLFLEFPRPDGGASEALIGAAGDVISQHGGTVVKSTVSRLYTVFQVADDALRTAAEIRDRVGEPVNGAMHHADVQPTGNHYIGEAFDLCAGLLGLAQGHLLLTRSAAGATSPPEEAYVLDRGDYRIAGADRPVAVFELIDDGEKTHRPLRSAPLARTNLGPAATRLVGREREIGEVIRLAARHSLMAITGPGGVGKTRLAMAVAAALPSFRDGIWLVDLSETTLGTLVASAVARAMGIDEQDFETTPSLVAALSGSTCCLILDACDPVIDEVGAVVDALMVGCPGVKVIVSSRQRVGLEEEVVYQLSGLTLPSPTAATADVAGDAESVQLLVERARRVDRDFRLTDENASAMAGICRLLDGLPLALELAAARFAVMAPAAVLERLRSSLDVLIGRRRSSVPRHRTLREAVGWSVALVDDKARSFLDRLAVFPGSFDVEAVEAIVHEADAIDLLADLSDRSLLSTTRAREQVRFWMSRPVRDWSLASLDSAVLASLRRHHAEHYLERAAAAAPAMRQSSGLEILDALDLDRANFCAALEWSLEEDPPGAARIAAALWRFWYQRGYLSEGRLWLDRVLATDPVGGPELGDALHGAAVLAFAQGDLERAELFHDRELERSRDVGDEAAVASALVFLGSLAKVKGDDEAATRLLEEGLAIHDRIDHEVGVASALSVMGGAGEFGGRLVRFSEEALEGYARRGDEWGAATTRWYLGVVLAGEDPKAARDMLREAAAGFATLGDRRGLAQCLVGLASLLSGAGLDTEATRLLAAADRQRSQGDAAPTSHEAKVVEVESRRLMKVMGEQYRREWCIGSTLTVEQALRLGDSL